MLHLHTFFLHFYTFFFNFNNIFLSIVDGMMSYLFLSVVVACETGNEHFEVSFVVFLLVVIVFSFT